MLSTIEWAQRLEAQLRKNRTLHLNGTGDEELNYYIMTETANSWEDFLQ